MFGKGRAVVTPSPYITVKVSLECKNQPVSVNKPLVYFYHLIKSVNVFYFTGSFNRNAKGFLSKETVITYHRF